MYTLNESENILNHYSSRFINSYLVFLPHTKLIMLFKHILIVAVLLLSQEMYSQDSVVQKNSTANNYSDFVKRLEGGEHNIDFLVFRNSYLASEQFKKKSSMGYDSIKTKMLEEFNKNHYNEAITYAKALIALDYTSLYAHKCLQQSYGNLNDTLNKNKYHDIEFGLLYSITKNGDGKSSETAWKVTQIEEEYFILDMLNVDLEEQSVVSFENHLYDKMKIKTESDESKIYYFNVDLVFDMYKK
jgi:Domain of unknown function (DUF4919)